MSSATIYKINKKGYFLHANRKAVSGFSLASEPFIQITEDNTDKNSVADAIKTVLNNDDSNRIADPKNWNEFHKDFLKKMRLKSAKELNKETTFCIVFAKNNGNIVFTPTKHAEPPDQGFSHKGKEEAITVPFSASDEEIREAFELALSKCE